VYPGPAEPGCPGCAGYPDCAGYPGWLGYPDCPGCPEYGYGFCSAPGSAAGNRVGGFSSGAGSSENGPGAAWAPEAPGAEPERQDVPEEPEGAA
jgi:hypothetical protein